MIIKVIFSASSYSQPENNSSESSVDAASLARLTDPNIRMDSLELAVGKTSLSVTEFSDT